MLHRQGSGGGGEAAGRIAASRMTRGSKSGSFHAMRQRMTASSRCATLPWTAETKIWEALEVGVRELSADGAQRRRKLLWRGFGSRW